MSEVRVCESCYFKQYASQADAPEYVAEADAMLCSACEAEATGDD